MKIKKLKASIRGVDQTERIEDTRKRISKLFDGMPPYNLNKNIPIHTTKSK